ncbi:MAG: LemA family protein [Bacteroidetes bacterium]|nr:LemA family protein [Bacteroidota bacterium]
MSKGLWIGGGIVLFVVIIFFWVTGQYNGMVTLNEEVNNAWAKVQSDYQRRSDLIPNLVETVKGAAVQEKSILLGVTEARAKVGQLSITPEILNNPQAFKQFQQAQDGLSSALSRLMVVNENYPQLKSNQNYQDLMGQLEGTENRIKKSRDDFNDVVKGFNQTIKKFPAVLFAGLFGFAPKQYFEAAAGSENSPKVQF